jgi:hypothetical protein
VAMEVNNLYRKRTRGADNAQGMFEIHIGFDEMYGILLNFHIRKRTIISRRT